jgi:hypothetical protein
MEWPDFFKSICHLCDFAPSKREEETRAK